MAVVAVMPLWFWTVWQLLGLGLMVFGAAALVLALIAPEDKPDGTLPGRRGNGQIKSRVRNKKIAVECKKGGSENGGSRGSDRQNP